MTYAGGNVWHYTVNIQGSWAYGFLGYTVYARDPAGNSATPISNGPNGSGNNYIQVAPSGCIIF
jgi:hypothetical protein